MTTSSGRQPPDKAERRPRQDGGALEVARGDGDETSVHRDPVSLALAVAELLELSDERDQWQQRLGDEFRAGFAIGHALGVDEGRRAEADERDQAWNRAAQPIARSGVTHSELELRRWGPGGREHFGDPRLTDRIRREGAA